MKGRGIRSYVPGRFAATTAVEIDDGWHSSEPEGESTVRPKTVVSDEMARSIISRNNSPDVGLSMARRSLVSVYFSITTLANRLAAKMEPRAAAPHARLRAMRTLHEAGIPVGVLVAPVIPMVNDKELERILEAAREHGVRSQGAGSHVLLRLPHELAQLWREWLELHYPERANHVMSLIQQMRGGKDYDSSFGKRMVGEGPFAQLIVQRFAAAYRRLGFGRMPGPSNSESAR
ncbi:radical SAM protein [Xanthomonas graminis]|uniref:radical SAM protein n=1 Tax=Xanthomonas graminis TaxID=3390026 RepID=UPI0009443453|nr:radical SAM protein [Xanthomonas translucens]UKE56456.1 radical SAM protein [Xanthomonas translucens pv. graminis]WIH10389.1 radical SAM protein [Xanthomonas translucens pv. graminis]WIH14427.1 radical SAM protein [Xanthomonas translucens pv. graminis]WIH18094.1 radical SAM protein [Xanthomonas translucens pv. graminis]